MGEGDLQRLRQPGDTRTAHTQAHQAVVQHAAIILQAQPGALWRESREARLQKGLLGGFWDPWPLPGGQSLRPGDQGTKGSPCLLLHMVSCSNWARGYPTVSLTSLWASSALLTRGRRAPRKISP